MISCFRINKIYLPKIYSVRPLFMSLILALCVSSCVAQITLTSGTYPVSLLGTDSLRVSIYNSPFPPLHAVTGGTWDMLTVTDTTPVFFGYRVPDPIYQYADSNKYNIGTFKYYGNASSAVTSSALHEYGVNVKYISYHLFPITSGATDTFFIPAQTSVYTSPLNKIGFPATENSTWQSAYSADVAFEISVGMYSLVHTPCFIRTYTTRHDTVKGWGKMRVRTAAGAASDYFDVLQVHSTTITTDSFFMNGTAAPGHIVTMLSLTQGKRDTTWTQRYYRMQEVTPLAVVEYKDAGFTQPKRTTTHMQRLAKASVSDFVNNRKFDVYPNPVFSGALSVVLPAAVDLCNYTLTDLNGKCFVSGELHTNTGFCPLTLPENIADGTYFLHIIAHNISLGVEAIVVSRH